MRIVAFILSIVILTSSVLPCTHDHRHQNDDKNKRIHHYQHDDHSDLHKVKTDSEEENEKEPCSPFCVCQCYFAPNVLAHKLTKSTLLISLMEAPQSFYIKNYTYTYLNYYWNPPV